jgi:hypothetical protein
MFPGQTDAHLAMYSRSDLNQYDIFAGHFSWALLDFLREALVVTILRSPAERIIAFYRYLRRQAESLAPADLAAPQHQGSRAALEDFERFLSAEDPTTGQIMLSYIDNFYMYYFATRVWNGRGFIRDAHPESDYFVSEHVLHVALRNLREHQLRVYCFLDLQHLVHDLSQEEGFSDFNLPFINSSADPEDRIDDILLSIAGDARRAKELLYLRSQFDSRIYREFF